MRNVENNQSYCEVDHSVCIFCQGKNLQIAQNTNELSSTYPRLKEKRQVIISTPNYYVIPDIAPITEDHLLIITRKHFPSFVTAVTELKYESEYLISKVVKQMHSFHPDKEILLFEHGAGSIDNQPITCGGCGGNDHAHLHILPIPTIQADNPATIISKKIIGDYKLSCHLVSKTPNMDFISVTNNAPYLYLATPNENNSYLLIQRSVDAIIPSQLIRKLIATEVLGFDSRNVLKWHWRDMLLFDAQFGEERTAKTLDRWQSKGD